MLSGVLHPYYDDATKMVYVAGKVHYYHPSVYDIHALHCHICIFNIHTPYESYLMCVGGCQYLLL